MFKLDLLFDTGTKIYNYRQRITPDKKKTARRASEKAEAEPGSDLPGLPRHVVAHGDTETSPTPRFAQDAHVE